MTLTDIWRFYVSPLFVPRITLAEHEAIVKSVIDQATKTIEERDEQLAAKDETIAGLQASEKNLEANVKFYQGERDRVSTRCAAALRALQS
jgi:cell division protein FtsB